MTQYYQSTLSTLAEWLVTYFADDYTLVGESSSNEMDACEKAAELETKADSQLLCAHIPNAFEA
ncbi:hypothetical protein ILT44_16805 [Microvirga sp. BT689]|uniref:hypothetical protein n=1 Tax=Microvirga arvi TaxID=2778731 RepID=UPI00195162A0|nr:hypothetical protein [Microvirga arvi]MBM6581859.1 hypothetical protein [Microvirga arvi]